MSNTCKALGYVCPLSVVERRLLPIQLVVELQQTMTSSFLRTAARRTPELILGANNIHSIGLPFSSRLDLAAAAGFDGVGIFGHPGFDTDTDPVIADLGPAGIVQLCHDRKLSVAEVELFIGWSSTKEQQRSEFNHSAASVQALSAAAGPVTIVAVATPDSTPRFDASSELPAVDLGEAFRELCSKVAPGCVVALEAFPPSCVKDVETAHSVLRGANLGTSTAGLCIDAWHFFHAPGGADWHALESLPPGCIHTLQLCDGPPRKRDALEPQRYLSETRTGRQLPGTGSFDLVRLLQTVAAGDLLAGPSARVSVEMCNSEELLGLGPEKGFVELASYTRALLSDAGWS